MIALQTAEAFADEIAETHARWFAKNPRGMLAQTCLILKEDGEGASVVCGWNDPEERKLVLAMLRALMVRERAVRYALWCETWMKFEKVKDAESFLADYEQGDLSRDPERIEAVFTIVADLSGTKAFRMQKIVRGRNGGVRKLEPLDPPGEGQGEGWEAYGGALGELLPERTFN